MASPLRVVVAEDHAMVRAGLIEIINGFDEFQVVGQAATGEAAIEAASVHKPDVIVLDLDMPDTLPRDLPPERTAVAVFHASPETKVIVLTMHEDPDTVRRLIRAGVSGYLTKTAGPDELRGALNASVRGDTNNIFIEVPRHTMLGLSGPTQQPKSALTAREVELLGHVALGASNREVARRLHIAEATVKRHLDRIFKKLDVNSRISAVNRARETGNL